MNRNLLVASVSAILLTATANGQEPRKIEKRTQLPIGALVRVSPQRPPRTNLLSEILAWPDPPQASYSIQMLTFSRNGKQLAIASADQTIRVMDSNSGNEIARSTKRDQHVHVLRYADDGQLIAVGTSWKNGDQGLSQSLSVWNVLTDKTIRDFTLLQSRKQPPMGSPVTTPIGVGHIVLSPDGRLLAGEAYVEGRRTIGIWDLANDKEGKLLVPNGTAPGPYSFSPGSKCLVSSGLDDKEPIRLWDIASGKELCRLAGMQYSIHQFAFTPDGQAVVTGLTNDICMWHVPSGKEIRRFQGHGQRTAYLAFSPNCLTLVSGSEDKTVRLWDVITGKQIHVWTGHETATGPVAFSPDGRVVASGSFDGTVFIWDVTTAAARTDVSLQTMEQLWDDLASLDADKAHRTFWTLARRQRDSVAYLKKRLSPVHAPDSRRIAQLISELNDGQFAKRQGAQRELEEIAEVAEPHLRMALKVGSQTLEGRRRIEALLDTLTETSSKMVRQRRAVAVLEAIGTAEAKAVLESLASGRKEAHLTRDSRTALNRLKTFKESRDPE